MVLALENDEVLAILGSNTKLQRIIFECLAEIRKNTVCPSPFQQASPPLPPPLSSPTVASASTVHAVVQSSASGPSVAGGGSASPAAVAPGTDPADDENKHRSS